MILFIPNRMHMTHLYKFSRQNDDYWMLDNPMAKESPPTGKAQIRHSYVSYASYKRNMHSEIDSAVVIDSDYIGFTYHLPNWTCEPIFCNKLVYESRHFNVYHGSNCFDLSFKCLNSIARSKLVSTSRAFPLKDCAHAELNCT